LDRENLKTNLKTEIEDLGEIESRGLTSQNIANAFMPRKRDPYIRGYVRASVEGSRLPSQVEPRFAPLYLEANMTFWSGESGLFASLFTNRYGCVGMALLCDATCTRRSLIRSLT